MIENNDEILLSVKASNKFNIGLLVDILILVVMIPIFTLFFFTENIWLISLGLLLNTFMFYFARSLCIDKILFYKDRMVFYWGYSSNGKTLYYDKIKRIMVRYVLSTAHSRSFNFTVYNNFLSGLFYNINGNKIGKEEEHQIKDLLKKLNLDSKEYKWLK